MPTLVAVPDLQCLLAAVLVPTVSSIKQPASLRRGHPVARSIWLGWRAFLCSCCLLRNGRWRSHTNAGHVASDLTSVISSMHTRSAGADLCCVSSSMRVLGVAIFFVCVGSPPHTHHPPSVCANFLGRFFRVIPGTVVESLWRSHL